MARLTFIPVVLENAKVSLKLKSKLLLFSNEFLRNLCFGFVEITELLIIETLEIISSVFSSQFFSSLIIISFLPTSILSSSSSLFFQHLFFGNPELNTDCVDFVCLIIDENVIGVSMTPGRETMTLVGDDVGPDNEELDEEEQEEIELGPGVEITLVDPLMTISSSSSSSSFLSVTKRLCVRIQDDSSCLYKYDFNANALPHLPHTCGFVFECVCTCARRFDLSANALLQIVHLNGFSPGKLNKL